MALLIAAPASCRRMRWRSSIGLRPNGETASATVPRQDMIASGRGYRLDKPRIVRRDSVRRERTARRVQPRRAAPPITAAGHEPHATTRHRFHKVVESRPAHRSNQGDFLRPGVHPRPGRRRFKSSLNTLRIRLDPRRWANCLQVLVGEHIGRPRAKAASPGRHGRGPGARADDQQGLAFERLTAGTVGTKSTSHHGQYRPPRQSAGSRR